MEINNPEVRCPECNSAQINASEKSVQDEKVLFITCLACGHEFIPGQGNIVQGSGSTIEDVGGNPLDIKIVQLLRSGSRLEAVKFTKTQTGWGLKESKAYVDRVAEQHGIPVAKGGGCFIATACYGDYNAPEVLVLRKFRDEFLQNNLFGKIFIQTYYFLSPPFATLLAKSEAGKRFVRRSLIQPLVNRLSQKQN